MGKRMKKVLALLLGVTMTVGMLAGCGSNGGGQSPDGGAQAETAESGTQQEASGSEASGEIDLSEYVDLKMYLIGDVPAGIDDVYAKINEILEEKLNCSVSIDWLSWAEHDTKYSLLFSSGEPFDMIFTATSWGHFEQTVGLGGFQALDEEMIKTYAPDAWEAWPEIAWEQARVNGNIYMLPANYVQVAPDVLAMRGDLVKKYGYEDLGGTPNQGQIILYNSQDPEDVTPQYILDWDAFTEYCHEVKELADAGCWPSDVLSSTQDRQDGLLSGRGASMVWKAGTCATYANQANAENPDWECTLYNIMPDIKYGASPYINGGIGINVASQHADRAIMVWNEFATNQEIQDLAQLGIEGVNWEPVGDKEYKKIEGAVYDGSNYWGWRNMDIMRTEYNENPTAVDLKLKEVDDYTLANVREEHVLDGFSFNSEAVSTQYAAVEAAMGTYFDPLINGLVDDVDASLEQFRAAMDAAGMQDVLAEINRQVEEYVASKQ